MLVFFVTYTPELEEPGSLFGSVHLDICFTFRLQIEREDASFRPFLAEETERSYVSLRQ